MNGLYGRIERATSLHSFGYFCFSKENREIQLLSSSIILRLSGADRRRKCRYISFNRANCTILPGCIAVPIDCRNCSTANYISLDNTTGRSTFVEMHAVALKLIGFTVVVSQRDMFLHCEIKIVRREGWDGFKIQYAVN